jgi:hypothetical protein
MLLFDTRAPDLITIDLGQPVHGVGDEFRTRVFGRVPFFPYCNVLDPKIGRDVDDLDPRIEQCARLLHGDTVGRGEKNDITLFEHRIRRRAEIQIDVSAQIRKHRGNGCAGLLARSDHRQFGVRMLRQ